jgi:SnoaL-like domain
MVDEAKLELMLARDVLHQLVTAYCRAVDRADYEALRSLYHPDATDSHGSFSTGGVEQFITELRAAEPARSASPSRAMRSLSRSVMGVSSRSAMRRLASGPTAAPPK